MTYGPGFMVFAVGICVLAIFCGMEQREKRKLRSLVFLNLDSAHDGGQFNRHPDEGYLYGLTAPEIAAYMELYCEDCSGYDRNRLLPHVQAWLKANAQKVYPT